MPKPLIAAGLLLAGLLASCSNLPTRPNPASFQPSNVNGVTGERTQY